MNPKSLACCGGLRVDYIITAEGNVRLRQMGGNALYAAAGARVWGCQPVILARVGDNFPAAWLERMRALGLDTRGVCRVPGWQEHRTFYAYLDAHTRDDTRPALHFARLGLPVPEDLRSYVHSTLGQDNPHAYEPLAVQPGDVAALAECPPSALHIAPCSIRTQLHVPAAARAIGARWVSADPGERAMRPNLLPFVEAVLSQVDAFMPSEQEVCTLFADRPQAEHPLLALRWFIEHGPRIAVVKQGARGVVLCDREAGRCWHVPAYPTTVVDVTGAGDAFCGGFMARFVQTADALESAVAGVVAASFTVEDYGPLHLFEVMPEKARVRAAWVRAHAQELKTT
ncbi:MAG: carbohydrate kinase family protein [Thermoflexales bacterium]